LRGERLLARVAMVASSELTLFMRKQKEGDQRNQWISQVDQSGSGQVTLTGTERTFQMRSA